MMRSNCLRLNHNKTEFMWCFTTRRLQRIVSGLIRLSTILIYPATSVCNRDAIMDQYFTMSSHIAKLLSFCFYSRKLIKLIRRSLTTDATKTLVNTLVTSRVNFCNLDLAGQPAYCINQVQ